MANPNKRCRFESEETPAFPEWLDLPEPLWELVLERLSLVDYIRFAAVCLQWRSIQRGHSLHHAPHHPPVANPLPWLMPRRLNQHRGFQYCSPLDGKSIGLPIPGSLDNTRCLASCNGWLLLLDDRDCGGVPTSKRPFLFNPITATQIPLPPLLLIPCSFAAMSTAPMDPACPFAAMSTAPTDPACVVLIVYGRNAFLCRPSDRCAADWTIIRLTSIPGIFEGTATYCGGKFYCSYDNVYELYVIDPFLPEATSQLAMAYPYEVSAVSVVASFLEIGGELFLVERLYGSDELFRLFKADLSRQEWVRVETLGDHVLFYHDDCSVLLLAADVGCKRNSIYACKGISFPLGHDLLIWGVFDLDAGRWTEEETLIDRYLGPWFLPTLDSACPTKTSD